MKFQNDEEAYFWQGVFLACLKTTTYDTFRLSVEMADAAVFALRDRSNG